MTKSELIKSLANRPPHLAPRDVELAVQSVIDNTVHSLSSGERIEIRGFGSFSLHYRTARIGRNPKTGESVSVASRYAVHFKPGKDLRDRVNASKNR